MSFFFTQPGDEALTSQGGPTPHVYFGYNNVDGDGCIEPNHTCHQGGHVTSMMSSRWSCDLNDVIKVVR